MPLSRALGVRIRQHRQKSGLSQFDFALCAKITQTHLCHIESGFVDMKLSTFADICAALDILPSDVLKEVEK